MNPYSWVVALHVMSVVACAGPVLVLALAAEGLPAPASQRLVRISSIGLLGVLVTGIAAIAMTAGALAHLWWRPASVTHPSLAAPSGHPATLTGSRVLLTPSRA